VRSTILASALLQTTDTLNLQRAVTGAHGDSEGEVLGTSSGNGVTVDTTNNTIHGGQVSVSSELNQWVVLTADERKNLKRLKEKNRKTKSPAHKKGTKPQGGLHAAARTDRHIKSLKGP